MSIDRMSAIELGKDYVRVMGQRDEMREALARLVELSDAGAIITPEDWTAAVEHASRLLAGTTPATCEWREDEDGAWLTDCDDEWGTVQGDPPARHYRHCPSCGKPLVAVAYTEPATEGDGE